MAEYIKRDDALRAIATTTLSDIAFGLVLDIPAADVRSVVRGHWITEEEAEEKGDYSLRDACSVCGHCDWDCTESASFNFCPNCGADMGGEDDVL